MKGLNWNDGYIVDLEYNDLYIHQINPTFINLNLVFAGIKPIKDTNFNYLELGFGKGASLFTHAMANDSKFYGVDFNPNHVVVLSNLIDNFDVDLQIYDDSFEELLRRLESKDIQFDFICLHGIYSWVNRKNQKIILEIIRKFLKWGGVCYVSYNCLPGWDGKQSVRHLLKQYSEFYKSDQMKEAAKNAIDFFIDFKQINPMYYQKNSILVESMIEKLSDSNLTYLLHEFFGDTWDNKYFTDVVKDFDEAKCEFATSADIMRHFVDMQLNQEEKNFFSRINNPIFAEQVKDYHFNTQFRMDLFVKGRVKLNQKELFEQFLEFDFILTKLPNVFDEKTITNLEQRKKYKNILDFLQKDSFSMKKVKSIQQEFDFEISELAQILSTLISQGMVYPAKKPSKKVIDRVKKYNQQTLKKLDKNAFISAPTGIVIVVNKIDKLFMSLYSEEDFVYTDDKVYKQMKLMDINLYEEDRLLEYKKAVEELRKFHKAFLENLSFFKAHYFLA
ncbi:class I SAM-dependent methyltransferase [Campylobacter armoricus]|uniref:Methyltransferase n=1 Tax=Campylobacter armoricus TaxID=2505970 RepID=A0A7L5IA99_9BACT|nr:class I SAM-dependent methyltransferase [Campylobacter armoricus]QKF79643.1 methyltransferase [Campylobacter armoricus]